MSVEVSKKKARVIAFYLPQFHPIPENDQVWGKGFTEWTNVGKAVPLFKGHYQPRVPADLGYYDLRLPEIREAQAEMAREAGVEGFLYWHYWFGNGRRVLEKPFNEVLNSGKPDFPFCLGWANHTWRTRDWNAASQWKGDMIIAEQTYPGKQDIIDHFNSLLPAFTDERYIKVDGKPIFMIFAPFEVPNVKEFMDIWNDLAVKNGLNGIYFIGRSYGWVSKNKEVLDLGFDAINSNGEWNAESIVTGKYLNLIRHKIIEKVGGVMLKKYSYKDIMDNFFTADDKLENVFPTIMPQWDRSPRSGRRAIIYHNSTPELFEKHVEKAIDIVKEKNDDHKILFLKSWNEWGEGNYVEPDLKYGWGYLNALKNKLY